MKKTEWYSLLESEIKHRNGESTKDDWLEWDDWESYRNAGLTPAEACKEAHRIY